MHAKSLHVQLFATLWTIARQTPLFMGFSRQKCWSGLPCPPPGDSPNPGIWTSLMSPALAGGFFTTSATWEEPAAAAKSLQLCPTLCDPIDGSPPGSPIPGILQARTLEWVAISFSSAWKWKVKVKLLSRVRLLVTPGTVAYQTPLSMGFSRQEYWSGFPLPSLGRAQCRLKILNGLMLWLNVTFRVLGLGWAYIAFGNKMNYCGLEARVWCVAFLSPVLNPKLYSCPLPFDIAVLSAKEVEYVSPPCDWIWPCGLIWPIKQKWWCACSNPGFQSSHIFPLALLYPWHGP